MAEQKGDSWNCVCGGKPGLNLNSKKCFIEKNEISKLIGFNGSLVDWISRGVAEKGASNGQLALLV